jgi:IS30 family transposase
MEKEKCENAKGLIRNFFPKGTDFGKVSKDKDKWVKESLNQRPIETLQFNTPTHILNLFI